MVCKRFIVLLISVFYLMQPNFGTKVTTPPEAGKPVSLLPQTSPTLEEIRESEGRASEDVRGSGVGSDVDVEGRLPVLLPHCEISNISRTKSQNLNVSRLVLQLSFCNLLKPVLRREWRCSWGIVDRRCSNYIWVVNSFIAYLCVTYIRGLTVTKQSLIIDLGHQWWIT